MIALHTLLRPVVLAAAAFSLLAGHAGAQQAGLRTLTVAGDVPMTVALFYPTATSARAVPMGPWQPVVAPGAPVADVQFKGLILLSHGTGGTEFNHHGLATRLARDGYLVAAVRHPGDNWQDRSLIASGRYFSERPRQISRVLDALLASPAWAARIPAGRIGAVGHSAGGYSVLALAGAQAEPQRAVQHCSTVADDPGFCALAKVTAGTDAAGAKAVPAYSASPQKEELVSVADPRIQAVVALAPMAVVFTPQSLATIGVPVRVIAAEQDAVLNGKYHTALVVANVRQVQASTAAGAGHFAFMAQASFPLPSAAGDAASNPAGFDRVAYLLELENQVADFLAAQWR